MDAVEQPEEWFHEWFQVGSVVAVGVAVRDLIRQGTGPFVDSVRPQHRGAQGEGQPVTKQDIKILQYLEYYSV